MSPYDELLRWARLSREAGGRWSVDIQLHEPGILARITTVTDPGFPDVVYHLSALEAGQWVPRGTIPLDTAMSYAKTKLDHDAAVGL